MKTLEKHIDEVMDWFDFDKVEKTMKFLNWEWHNEGVPTIPGMRQHVRGFMRELYAEGQNQESFRSVRASGGFYVEYTKNIDENGPWDRFDVSFRLVEWGTENYE
jgi:hypothetical protein